MLNGKKQSSSFKQAHFAVPILAALGIAIALDFGNSQFRTGRAPTPDERATKMNAYAEPLNRMDVFARVPTQTSSQFDLSRNVIAGGGGGSSNGSTKIDGTVGEVSGSNSMSGGTFTLNGGWWSAVQAAASPTPSPSPMPGAPTIFIEQGSVNRAVALDSVTFVRGPFSVASDHNFSGDHHTRVILFTSPLGLTQPDPLVLSVQASGTPLSVENVGTLLGVSGLDASYIVVRLPDGLPTGDLLVTVTLRGATSNPAILSISP